MKEKVKVRTYLIGGTSFRVEEDGSYNQNIVVKDISGVRAKKLAYSPTIDRARWDKFLERVRDNG